MRHDVIPRAAVLATAAICATLIWPATVSAQSDLVSPVLPLDIGPEGAGAPAASLEDAAVFAWREFIALNWPVKAGRRGVAAEGDSFDAPASRPRVWETFKARVEAYPGTGTPWGEGRAPADYGFDQPPRYQYSPQKVAGSDAAPGRTVACDGRTTTSAPWHNLDEPNHNGGRSGLSPREPFPGQQILMESKVNREHYGYVAARGWYGERSIRDLRRDTGLYVRTRFEAPPPGKRDRPQAGELISFPNGAIEIKAAWRRLAPAEDVSRFFSRPVRYYRSEAGGYCHYDSSDQPEDRWGLLALHVMHKTPSAPYFIWATFEQVDVMLTDERDATGRPLLAEHADGTLTEAGARVTRPFSPEIEIGPASYEQEQQYRYHATVAQSPQPGPGLYFIPANDNELLPALPPDTNRVDMRKRLFPTPAIIARINARFQQAIRARHPGSPFQFYRLVSVQWKPLDKAPGVLYTGPEDPAVYYSSSVIIEPPPVHQMFSGQLALGFDTSTDYVFRELRFLNPPPNPGAPVFNNTHFDGKPFLAGGCMGCHGQRQVYGTDWSFLLERQRVIEPEVIP